MLIPSKLWPVASAEDSWSRRLLLMALGFGVGLVALWLDGYALPPPWLPGAEQAEVFRPWVPGADEAQSGPSWYHWIYKDNRSMPVLACEAKNEALLERNELALVAPFQHASTPSRQGTRCESYW